MGPAKNRKILSQKSLSSYGLWYSKRLSQTHDERVFYGFQNHAIHIENLAFFSPFFTCILQISPAYRVTRKKVDLFSGFSEENLGSNIIS